MLYRWEVKLDQSVNQSISAGRGMVPLPICSHSHLHTVTPHPSRQHNVSTSAPRFALQTLWLPLWREIVQSSCSSLLCVLTPNHMVRLHPSSTHPTPHPRPFPPLTPVAAWPVHPHATVLQQPSISHSNNGPVFHISHPSNGPIFHISHSSNGPIFHISHTSNGQYFTFRTPAKAQYFTFHTPLMAQYFKFHTPAMVQYFTFHTPAMGQYFTFHTPAMAPILHISHLSNISHSSNGPIFYTETTAQYFTLLHTEKKKKKKKVLQQSSISHSRNGPIFHTATQEGEGGQQQQQGVRSETYS